MRKSSERGQLLLIIILVMVVVLTVGLAIASRTVTNIKISKQSEESQRAFQAAEAGIESAVRAVRQGAGTTTVTQQKKFGNLASVSWEAEAEAQDRFLINQGLPLQQDVGVDIWLSNFPDGTDRFDGRVSYYFDLTQVNSAAQDCASATAAERERAVPALEILLVRGDLNNPTLEKQIIDPCSGRTPGAGTGAVNPPASEADFGNGVRFWRSGGWSAVGMSQGILMRIIPLYNSAMVGVNFECNGACSTPTYPYRKAAGVKVTSTGTSGESVRKLEYFETFPQAPLELFHSIMSQNAT